ncbi:uncharacterized protein LOC113272107 [Papaver somniferum]|uniref:uncharacterized protein LOC113272107 n=1 Tax=Papaver somniferum TaxID=3469 RepID=UPI000E6FA0FC|nr:uncharacterized protein LOC113272107 [Papaver somniferum]
MLRAYVLDFQGNWDEYLPWVQFAYNNSYHSSIGMAPFETLYGRPCRSPSCWVEVGEKRFLGPDLVQLTTEKILLFKDCLRKAQSKQKSYADRKRRSLPPELEMRHLVDEERSQQAELSELVVKPDATVEDKPIRIVEQQVRQLRSRAIPFVKVQWNPQDEREASWELENVIRRSHPHLFNNENKHISNLVATISNPYYIIGDLNALLDSSDGS